MKKSIPAILALLLCICMASTPEIPVLAADDSIPKGGITFNIPTNFKKYTEEEFAQSTNSLFNGILSLFDFGDFGNFLASLGATGASIGFTEYEYSDNMERILANLSKGQVFKIYCLGKVSVDVSDLPYYDIRENYLTNWVNYLTDKGYTTNIYDAIWCYTDPGGIPYIQLDGTSNNKGCCRLAIFQYNGYLDIVAFINSRSSDMSSSETTFDGFINSVSIAQSSSKGERDGLKYDCILFDRIELQD